MSVSDPAAVHADEIAAFLAAAPPRTVPAKLRRAAMRQSAPMASLVIGGLFLLMGSFFAWVFLPWNFYRDWRLAAADTATANGRVISSARTNLSINKTRVMSFAFEFRGPAGERVVGTCYATGERWRAGNAVTVRYRPEEPAVCCLVGARSSEGDWSSLFVLIFPLMGGGLVAWAVVARRRMEALLVRGFLAEALVTGIEQTNVRINGRYVRKIVLQRTDSPDGSALTVKSYRPEVIAFANERQAANQPVFVLYDPAKPKRALLPETL